jgi:hypothetical protein
MQGNPSQGSEVEPRNRTIQRAIMAVTLAAFPKQLKRADLSFQFGSIDPWEQAICDLAIAGLLWLEGDVVLPTLAARQFDWLEQG